MARTLAEEGCALIISHADILEAAALLDCPRYHLDEICGEIGFCEGVDFKFDAENLTGIEMERLPKKT